jgi:pilus assembly protein CpaB
MDRNTRTLLVVLIAVLTAGGATYGIYRAIQRIPVRQVEVPSTYVVAAAKPITAGTLLTAADLRLVPWPERNQVPGSFTKMDDVVNRGVISDILENEPVTDGKLAPVNAGAGLPPMIPQGMRAISVRVNDVIGVAGFVVPGTRVDVLVTLREGNDAATRLVVSNVQVLTAGTRYEQDKSKSEPIPTSVVTLLLAPEDASRVVLAASDGQIMLALRNPLDVAPTDRADARIQSLFSDRKEPAPAPASVRRSAPRVQQAVVPPPAPEVAKPYVVEAIRAAKRSDEALK